MTSTLEGNGRGGGVVAKKWQLMTRGEGRSQYPPKVIMSSRDARMDEFQETLGKGGGSKSNCCSFFPLSKCSKGGGWGREVNSNPKKIVANCKTSSVSQIKSRVALSSLVIGHSSRIGEISTESTWPEHLSTLWCSTVYKTKYFLKDYDPLTTYPSSTQTLQTHPYLRKFIGCLAEGGGTEKCSSYFRWKSDQHPNSARI